MDKLESLQRFDADYAIEDMIPFNDGDYVLYTAAQDRERVLVDTLRHLRNDCKNIGASRPVCCFDETLSETDSILAQYDAEQEGK